MDKKQERMLDNAKALSELSRLIEEVSAVDLDKLKVEKMGPAERYFTQREKDYLAGRIRRKVKPDKRKPENQRKMHWKTRAKKRKEYYKQVAYPRYLRKMSQLQAEKGWYDIMKRGWENWGWKCEITREEWDTHVQPLLVGKVPYTERYRTSDPVIRLDNIMIFDKQSKGRLRKPLFDGATWFLKEQGYCL